MKLHELVKRTPCPFVIGQRVRVKKTAKFAEDFPDDAFIVGIVWEYQKVPHPQYNIWLANEGEIELDYGATDGWRVDDLEAV